VRSVVLAGVDHEASNNATDIKIAIRRKIGGIIRARAMSFLRITHCT